MAVGKGARLQNEKKLSAKWLFFWGMFPDLFAFTLIFVVSIVQKIFGLSVSLGRPSITTIEPWTPGFDSLSNFTQLLYQLSHSLVVFLLVIATYYIWKKRLPWVLLGWPLHILADVPTHSHAFYATPVFWPLTHWKFDGISWGAGYFTLYNYLAIGAAFLLLYIIKKYLARRTTSTAKP